MPAVSKAITNGLCVSVESEFIPERSNPDQPLFFFAYHITIKNEGDRPLTLRNRYWHITDAAGQVEEVRGPGVVGYQPRLEKDQSFQYTSFCPLRTEFGTMKGTYEMVWDDGETFDAEIPAFQLVTPHSVN